MEKRGLGLESEGVKNQSKQGMSSGLISFSCHDLLLFSKLLFHNHTESRVCLLCKHRPSLHDGGEADTAPRRLERPPLRL